MAAAKEAERQAQRPPMKTLKFTLSAWGVLPAKNETEGCCLPRTQTTSKVKLSKIRIVTTFADVTAHAENLADDLRWHPHEVEFWQRLHDTAKDELWRAKYATHLLKAKCFADAIKKMSVANES